MPDYIEKKLTLNIIVPSTFDHACERDLNTALENLLSQKGLSLVSSAPYETVNQFIFDDELCVEDKNCECIDGYLWATGALVSRLKEQIKTEAPEIDPSSLDNPNFFFVYDITTGFGHIEGSFDFTDASGNNASRSFEKLALTSDELRQVKTAMEEFCHEKYSMSCVAFVNEARSHAGLPSLSVSFSADAPAQDSDISRSRLQKQSDPRIHVYLDNKQDDARQYHDLLFWSDAYGQIQHPYGDEFPFSALHPLLQQAYQTLFSDDLDSRCYLAETPAGYGMALCNEYDCETAAWANLSPSELFEAAIRDAQRLSAMPDFDQAREFFVLESYGPNYSDLYHELVVVFPADMDKDAFETASKRLGEEIYKGVSEYSAEKRAKLQTSVDRLIQDAQYKTEPKEPVQPVKTPEHAI